MQLIIATRGIKHDVDRFIGLLQGVWLPFQYQDRTMSLQVGVRPVQLWELAFPKEHLQLMLRTLWDEEITRRAGFKTPLALLRKALKLKKIPDIDKSIQPPLKMPIYKQNVGIHPIGLHEDEDIKTEGI